jgi:hypothetical protein
VGAGLPILSTLKVLLETGDAVSRIEGVLSGTLSYIFNALRPGTAFSEVVRDAAGRGYTEPDPREDLSGGWTGRRGGGSAQGSVGGKQGGAVGGRRCCVVSMVTRAATLA